MGAFDHLIPQADNGGGAFSHLIPGALPSENPGLSATGSGRPNEIGQLPQGFNEALYQTAMSPFNAWDWMLRSTGAVPKDTVPLSEKIRTGGNMFGGTYSPQHIAQTDTGRVLNDVGQAAGTVASTVAPIGFGLKVGQELPTLGNAIQQTYGMARPAVTTAPTVGRGIADAVASQPGIQVASNATGNVAGDLSENPYVGLAASFAPPALAHGGMRVPYSAPATTGAEAERRALLATAKDNGILPSFGTIQDSWPAKMFESIVSKLPFMGNAQAKLNENNKTAFDTAAINKLPEMRNEGVDAFTSGNRDMIGSRIGQKFNALENGTTINIDSQVGTDIAKAKGDFSKNLEANMSPRVAKQLNELGSVPTTGNPQIDGETYKNIRSDLSKMLTSATGTDRDAVGDMINALDSAVERSLPKDQVQDWKDARQSWQRFMMLKGATDARHNSQTDLGHIPPGSLAARVGNDKEMERLAQVGTSFVGDKTPDSGTAMRLLIQNAMGLGGTAAGALTFPTTTALLAGGGMAANAMMNNPYTRAALINRLQSSKEGVLNKGLVATLAGQQGLQNGR